MNLLDFIDESNRIEGIRRPVRDAEIQAHETLLSAAFLSVPKLEHFVDVVAGVKLRNRKGMDVRVGSHYPPPGGEHIHAQLKALLDSLKPGSSFLPSPYELHQQYESLHPFMDGNDRSGRAVWAWHRQEIGRDPFSLGFLHSWYYESLNATRKG